MNYHSRILGVAVSASRVLLTVPLLAVTRADRDFYRAIESGATAQLTVKVVDDVGRPVGGVNIEARFAPAFNAPGEKKLFTTDTNGIAIVSGRTGKSVSLRTTKDGFYGSSEKIDYVALGQGVKGVKWLPWGMKKEIVLRPVRKPVANKPYFSSGKYTMDTGKWLGFDIETYDFVSPNGNGTIADFEVKFEWDGQRGKNFHGMDMIIRFVEPYAGAYYYDRTMTSDFRDAYSANTNEFYQKEFVFYSHPIRNSDGEIVKRDQKLFDMSKSLVVRSRCILNEDGTLNQARYSEIAELSFGCSSKGTWIMFQPIFNPTPNDTNLEPKR